MYIYVLIPIALVMLLAYFPGGIRKRFKKQSDPPGRHSKR